MDLKKDLTLTSLASFACSLFKEEDTYKVAIDKNKDELSITVEKDGRKAYFTSNDLNILRHAIHERFNKKML